MARCLFTRLSTPRSPPHIHHIRLRSTSPEETTRAALKKLEDAIHKIIAKKLQPGWVPFLPGASYWVPPKSRAQGLAQVIGKIISDNNKSTAALMKDKKVYVYPNRGWPSSAQFFKGVSNSPLEGDITPKKTSESEDEEW